MKTKSIPSPAAASSDQEITFGKMRPIGKRVAKARAACPEGKEP